MSDVLVVFDPVNNQFDWALNAAGNDLAIGPSLYSAAYISAFSDRRASADDVIPDGSTDRRGHWTDTGSRYLIGSLMWLISRSKATRDIPLKAKNYLIAAHQWAIDDGLIDSLDVQAEFSRPNMLGVKITFYKQGHPADVLAFDWAWGELS